jgi:hypothetical protein
MQRAGADLDTKEQIFNVTIHFKPKQGDRHNHPYICSKKRRCYSSQAVRLAFKNME